MAAYVAYSPTSLIGKALFNFDEFGIPNYKLTDTIKVSISDALTYANFLAASGSFSSSVYTSFGSGSANWSQGQVDNISAILSTFSNMAGVSFSTVANYSGYTPINVGTASDIDIALIYRTDLAFSGFSSGSLDSNFGYLGARGDVVVNVAGLGSFGLLNDYSFAADSFGWHTLMHEIAHSLGLSHPHASYSQSGQATLTSDFSALEGLGFDKLGFQIHSATDLNKEYFTIMSYDDEKPFFSFNTYAQTPMILDVIALQEAYGEGAGSTGASNDLITPGGAGGVGAYRTYFDKGGTSDIVSLINYTDGAYFNMGTTILGANHLVGVSMSLADAQTMTEGGNPDSLRWYYGEFENAIGSLANDLIWGNDLPNSIAGLAGTDAIIGGGGNDTILGGDGDDALTGGDGIDSIDGGAGYDGVAFADDQSVIASLKSQSAVTWLISDGTWVDGHASESIVNVEQLMGSGNDDSLFGDSGSNMLNGAGGDDFLYGYDGNDNLLGGDGRDNIQGGSGNDTLVGGGGNDVLVGGFGADRFVFDAVLGTTTNIDTIRDFDPGRDKIVLENAVFGALIFTGSLNAAYFHIGTGIANAADSNDYLNYDTSTGALYYDPDGVSGQSPIQFAIFYGHPSLAATDFLVI